MRLKQILPLIYIVAGSLLLLSGVGYALFSQAVRDPSPAPLPEQLAGLPMVRRTTGWQAANEISRLHRKEFLLTSAAVGVYGSEEQATLWVSGAPLELLSARLLSSMKEAIARGNSPFTPIGERLYGERVVYALEGMGKKHFYFQSGNLLIWLAADPSLAEEALKEGLEFYP